jgi:choline dehydrogenase-like flavoprotein
MKIKNHFDYIIVGGGTAGLVLAEKLSLENKKILILEKGGVVKGVGTNYIARYYDKFALGPKTKQGFIIYRLIGLGGTSIVSMNNAIPSGLEDFKNVGIDLSEEVDRIKNEYNVNTTEFPQGKTTKRIMESANELGYDMHPMPKFGSPKGNRCYSCGNCLLGCKFGAKWSSLDNLEKSHKENITIATHSPVSKIIVSNGKATGVKIKLFGKKKFFFADKVIISAGALGTPVILLNSGIDNAGNNLFVDFFNVTFGILKDSNQFHEVQMNVVCDKSYKEQGFILSPYMDNIIALASTAPKKYMGSFFNLRNLVGIMTKIKDRPEGVVNRDGTIDKDIFPEDITKLREGSRLAKEILVNLGVEEKSIFVCKPRGAHPGGTAGIGRIVNSNLETEIKNLFVCDVSVFPTSKGLPPILTLLALINWFVKNVLEKDAK